MERLQACAPTLGDVDERPAGDSSPRKDRDEDSNELLASIRRLRRLEREKRLTPTATPRFEAIARELEAAAREIFRRAASFGEPRKSGEPGRSTDAGSSADEAGSNGRDPANHAGDPPHRNT
jgi:hypothetical protein